MHWTLIVNLGSMKDHASQQYNPQAYAPTKVNN